MPAIVPKNVARVAALIAIFRLNNNAEMTWSFFHSSTYQRVENPPQIVASFESLKE